MSQQIRFPSQRTGSRRFIPEPSLIALLSVRDSVRLRAMPGLALASTHNPSVAGSIPACPTSSEAVFELVSCEGPQSRQAALGRRPRRDHVPRPTSRGA